MNNQSYLEWSKEEKEKYAAEKVRLMREKNLEIQRRYALAERDKRAAENQNSSVTNSTKAQRQDIPSEEYKEDRVDRDVTKYTREWDRGKDDFDWESHNPKGFTNYRGNNFERKNQTRGSFQYERNRNYVSDRRNQKQHYNKDQYNRPHFNESSSRQRWTQSSESSKSFQRKSDKDETVEKYLNDNDIPNLSSSNRNKPRQTKKSFPFPSNFKKPNKHSSNSSTDSERIDSKWSKTKSANTETSALWHSERSNDDKNKRERTGDWIKSVQECRLQDTDESFEKTNSTSPKKKLDKVETASEKGLNELPSLPSYSSTNKPRQISNLKSQKLNYSNKSNTKGNQITEQDQFTGKNYTKFDRLNCSNRSSDDSDSNSNLGRVGSKYNMKSEITRSKANKNLHDSGKDDSVRKVYSHNEGFIISREYTCADNEQNLKMVSKTKRNPDTNPQYNSPESYKNEHFSKQRKFDKGQPNKSWNSTPGRKNRNMKMDENKSGYNRFQSTKQADDGWGDISQSQDDDADDEGNWSTTGGKNRSMKIDQKKSGYNVGQSTNQVDDGWGNVAQSQDQVDDGWGDIPQPQARVDDGWDDIPQSKAQDDEAVWGSAGQSNKKWEMNEEDKKATKNNSGGYKKKETKIFNVKNPTASDDGGWSTVEEGEICSDNGM